MRKFLPFITRTVFILSAVSLLNDIGSEMLYPVMPLFLTSIGFSTVAIGFFEGIAQAVSGFGSMYFGRESDLVQKRKPFVELGYSLTAFSKLILGLSKFTPLVFIARSIDRLGKGVRTGARDAILSDETTPENKGKVFGFHRAMEYYRCGYRPCYCFVIVSVVSTPISKDIFNCICARGIKHLFNLFYY